MSKGLDLNKLKNRHGKIVSSKEALEDVVQEVLDGKRKTYVKAADVDISKCIKKCTKKYGKALSKLSR